MQLFRGAGPQAEDTEDLATLTCEALVKGPRKLRDALATISDNDRQILWLREVEKLSYDAISGPLSGSAAPIRVACHRTRQRLANAFAAISPPNITNEARTP